MPGISMSVQVGKVKDIPIRIHFTLIIAVLLISFTLASDFMPYYFPNLSTDKYWAIGIAGAFIMFFSVLVHEIAHSILAQRYGIKVREIVLFVFGGVSDISVEPKDYRKEIKMAAAGPLTSFILAGVSGSLFFILSSDYVPLMYPAKDTLLPILFYTAIVNTGLGAFNLIPAFPSDGGRILRSLLIKRNKDYNQATRSAAKVGIWISYVFVAAGFFILFTGDLIGGIWLLLLAWFLRNGAEGYLEQIRLTSVLSKVHLSDIMTTDIITVSQDMTANELLNGHFQRYMKSSFPVVDNTQHLIGLVTLTRVLALPENRRDILTAQDVMIPKSELIIMDAEMTADKAMEQMTTRKVGKVMVCDADGKLAGIVSKTDILNVETERGDVIQMVKKPRASPEMPY
jgi:Zn-dependent protease/predicted transcriptional regulator